MTASTVVLSDSDKDDDNEPPFVLPTSELKSNDKVESDVEPSFQNITERD